MMKPKNKNFAKAVTNYYSMKYKNGTLCIKDDKIWPHGKIYLGTLE